MGKSLDKKQAENMWKKSEQDPRAKAATVCPTCKENVYIHERGFSYFGNHYHAGCYRCINCNKSFNKIDKIRHRDKKPYCEKCYKEVFAEELQKANQQVPISDDPVQVQGGGMDYENEEVGGNRLKDLYQGVATKRLNFVTISVIGDSIVYPRE